MDIADFDYPEIKHNITFFKGDICDIELLRKAMDQTDIVVHCAAALPLWSKKRIFFTNVEGTRRILQVARDKGVERVIFISSTSVYGIPEKHPIDETHPLKGFGPYGESKVDAEKVCKEFREKGMCVPILRPRTFAGPGRLGVFQILCEWVKDGKNIPIIGSGENKYQLLHIGDLVEVIHLIAMAPRRKVNDIFNVGATEFRTLKEDLQKLLDYAGTRKRVVPLPPNLVIPVLKVFYRFGASPLYEWIYETARVDYYVSTEKIQKILRWSPKKSTADTWIDTYKWYVKEYKTRQRVAGITHTAPWDQGVLKIVKLFF
jgi:nucleoside-diphosphate-sugar epimerase